MAETETRAPIPSEFLRFFTPQQQGELLTSPTAENLDLIRAEAAATGKAQQEAVTATAPALTQPTATRRAPEPSTFPQAFQAIASRLFFDTAFRGLVNALIQHESGGRQGVESSKGAVGLMQLRGTFRSPETERSPRKNILVGARYLGSLLERYGGDVRTTLMAYNWGPGRVDRARSRFGQEFDRGVPESVLAFSRRVLSSWQQGAIKDYVTQHLSPRVAEAARQGGRRGAK